MEKIDHVFKNENGIVVIGPSKALNALKNLELGIDIEEGELIAEYAVIKSTPDILDDMFLRLTVLDA